MGEKVKVVLDMANFATKKELKDATGVDTSNLAAKGDFVALEAEFYKPEINKFVGGPSSLQNLKTKIDLDLGNLKTLPVDLNEISDVVDKQGVENRKFNTLDMKVNNLKKEILVLTTLIYIN